MSNQEPQHKEKTIEEGVEKRRRFIKGAGIAVPVVLTLSSPSVFGIDCGSEIASGNQSHTGTGSCTSGLTIAQLSNPSNGSSWPSPYLYGTKNTTSTRANTRSISATYSGGTQFKDAFAFDGNDKTTLREYLVSGIGSSPSLNACLSAALLNAAISKTYPLTVAQVQAIQAKTLGSLPTKPGQIPNDNDVIAYLKSTW